MTAKIYMFRPKNVDHLKYQKGKVTQEEYEILKALYKAMSGGHDHEAWNILKGIKK